MARTLLLGGTSEARSLARALAERGADAVFSFAGRVERPAPAALPTRIGGFGGVDGLATYLETEKIARVVDATHPFAAQMSANAHEACARTGVPLLALERPPWRPEKGDRWRSFATLDAAAAALPATKRTIFLAIGRQGLGAFAERAEHLYLLRLVDPLEGAAPVPTAAVLLDRGPFDAAADEALMRRHAVDLVVAKNAGGTGAAAKLEAARALGLEVYMVERPAVPPRRVARNVEEALAWLDHDTRLGV